MPPSPQKLRLAQVNPETLAVLCETVVLERTKDMLQCVGAKLLSAPEPGSGPLGTNIVRLVRYAQGSAPLDGALMPFLKRIFACVVVAPLPGRNRSDDLPSWLVGADLGMMFDDTIHNQLSIVVTAALGRKLMNDGGSLKAAHIAALAGIDVDSARRLIRQGTFGAHVRLDEVPANEVRSWLAKRSQILSVVESTEGSIGHMNTYDDIRKPAPPIASKAEVSLSKAAKDLLETIRREGKIAHVSYHNSRAMTKRILLLQRKKLVSIKTLPEQDGLLHWEITPSDGASSGST